MASLRGAGVDRVRRIHRQHGRGKALFEETADAMVEVGSTPHASSQDTRSRRHTQDQIPIPASWPLQPGKLKSGNGPIGCLTPEFLVVPKVPVAQGGERHGAALQGIVPGRIDDLSGAGLLETEPHAMKGRRIYTCSDSGCNRTQGSPLGVRIVVIVLARVTLTRKFWRAWSSI